MAIDPVTAVLDIGGKVIDRLWPNKADAEQARIKLVELAQSGELAVLTSETELIKGQLEVNAVEAASTSLWVAGARPFIMWTCGAAFAYHFVALPFFAFCFSAAGHPIEMPVFNMDALNTVMFGMLGLGGMRTYEKKIGVSR